MKTLYEGRVPNALGDLRYQRIVEVTPEMGVSILGPVHRSDRLYGLPDVHEPGSEVPPYSFEKKFGDYEQVFKIAAIRFMPEDQMKGHEPHQGLFFRPVGYHTAGDTYERNWSLQEIKAFLQTILELGIAGIIPDPYLDEDWHRSVVRAKVNLAFQAKRLTIQVNIPIGSRCGDPSARLEPVSFILCNCYSLKWRDVAPPGGELRSVVVSRSDDRLHVRGFITLNGKTISHDYF